MVTNLDLEREMRKALLDLEMTSCGVTPNPDGNGGGAFSSQPPKSGDWDPPHLRLRRDWDAAIGETARRGVLERAKDELDAIRKSRAGQGSETESERTVRLLQEGEGHPAQAVALRFGMTIAQVERTRKRAGRNRATGEINPYVPLPEGASIEERRERVRLLRAAAMPSREIAEQMGVSQTQVMKDYRWLDAQVASVANVA